MNLHPAIESRLRATWGAVKDLAVQAALWVDQGLNAIGLGLLAVLVAIVTGREHDTAFADETLSAHAYRARERGRIWGRLSEPVIDLFFSLQKVDPAIVDNDGNLVPGHCRRAFHKKRLRTGLPEDYRDPNFGKAKP